VEPRRGRRDCHPRQIPERVHPITVTGAETNTARAASTTLRRASHRWVGGPDRPASASQPPWPARPRKRTVVPMTDFPIPAVPAASPILGW